MRALLYCALCAISVFCLRGELRAQTFQDVSVAAGFFGLNASWAAAWGDYDHDGHLDVITTGHLQPKTNSITQLWHNNGDGTFSDVTVQAGLIPTNGDPHGVVWADYDNNGDLDLYIARGGLPDDPGPEFYRNNGDGTFTNIATLNGTAAIRGLGACSVDYNRDGKLDLFAARWCDAENPHCPGNHLGRNDGNLHFTDVGQAAGVANKQQLNRAAVWADFNGDGFPDVMVFAPYILEPPPDPNAPFCVLFTNQGDGAFADVTKAAGIGVVSTCAAGAWGDYDNDGDVDLYITMTGNTLGLLYRNNGNGTFTDVTAASGAINASDARGVVWGDYDNDGYLDLYIVNIANATTPKRLFRNNGDGTFAEVTAEAGVEVQVAGGGVDATFVDYNDDGFLDLFVTNGASNLKGPYVLLENRGKQLGNQNHWLKVELEGKSSNRDGIMTKVSATTAQGRQFREYTGPQHYMAQDHTPLHFGLGTATVVERLELGWPSGVSQLVENLAMDQLVTLVEGQSIALGQPSFTGLGYYLWQTASGEWHLRWYGEAGEPKRQFTGHITTDGTFTSVVPKQFDDNDRVTWDASTIAFTAFARDNFDEVVFVTTGTQVSFELQWDGAEDPRAVHIGQHGLRPGTLPLTLAN